MSRYTATVSWSTDSTEFLAGNYSRTHLWKFDGGAAIEASSSPQIVPLPWSAPEHVDPEEAFVASISSCHMLFFLSLAARDGLVVEHYVDDAEGFLEKNDEKKLAMTRVILNPRVRFSTPVARSKLDALHHKSHELCFIANSIRTSITVVPQESD
jgi:organic hydroperoxide reductase OsmC/OhrA